jgi:hypothetical protein
MDLDSSIRHMGVVTITQKHRNSPKNKRKLMKNKNIFEYRPPTKKEIEYGASLIPLVKKALKESAKRHNKEK